MDDITKLYDAVADMLRHRRDEVLLDAEGGGVSIRARVVVCDFCTSKGNITHDVLCPDFSMPDGSLNQISRGNWAACATCAALILDGQWDALSARSIALGRARGVIAHAEAEHLLRALHAEVRTHMTGIRPTVGLQQNLRR